MRRISVRQTGLAALAVLGAWAFPAAAQTPVKGGTLAGIVQPEPPILMLALNQQGPTIYVAGKIYQSLLTYEFDLKPRPVLAKSWTMSPDGLAYTFDLQENVKWHDGKPFTAGDVVFSVDVFLRKMHPRARVTIDRYIASVTALSPVKVEFKLKEPFGPFLSLFEVSTLPMVPKHVYDGTDFATNPANQTPIGTRPFKFKEWRKGSHIHLVRNEEYWKPGMPYLDELYFRVIPDAASRGVAFERGDVQVLRGGDVDNVDIRRLRGISGVETTTKGWEMYSPLSFMMMNMRKPPFDNLKVRQAAMHALDKSFIQRTIFFGLAKVANGPIASTTLFHDASIKPYAFDVALAKKLAAESGVDLSKTPVKILAFPYGAQWDRLTEYVKQALEQVGFKVSIEPTDAGGWAKRVGDWDFDISFNFTYQYGDPALGVARHYLSSNIVKGSPFANNQGYSNPKVDDLLRQAASAVKAEDRAKLYAEAQRILVEEVANGYLVELEFPTLWRSNVKNLVQTAIGLNESFEDVWIAK
ncbi:MAG TPA: ABC transporter substrate-binding protein [Beijerinckiaceae bacterium]|jgi:peptide/nickel transport system substrate-binding protein|nr:ABC transporter substrate-binding protein [Beijerinckiaceae bacterium]